MVSSSQKVRKKCFITHIETVCMTLIVTQLLRSTHSLNDLIAPLMNLINHHKTNHPNHLKKKMFQNLQASSSPQHKFTQFP